jgi:GNAT superfamily N-acetyltransferase
MIAEYNGIVTGWSYANIQTGKDMWSFVVVFVSDLFRRNGIGTALYLEAEKRCIESGCEELFITYYDANGTDKFIRKFAFTYSTSDSLMEYTGEPLPEIKYDIRKYKDEDYYRFDSIWSRGIFEMHKRIGLPVTKPTAPSDEFRQQNRDNAENLYVLEDNGIIVAVGGLMGNLAVDLEMNNRGYGTALASFLTNEILRRGSKVAYLSCETGNDNAFYIYIKIGYREIYKEYSSIKKLIF